MFSPRHLPILGLSVATFMGQSLGWLLEFWNSQPNCGDNGGSADTERGGLSGQGYCSLVSLEDIKAMKISDWDDGCKVSLHSGTSACSGDPVWEAYKEEMAEDDLLVNNNWTCNVNLEGQAILYAEYNCEDEP